MRPDELAAGIERILRVSPALPGRLAGALLIANPKAGGFTRPTYAHRRNHELDEVLAHAGGLEPRPDPPPFVVAITERPGHAASITRSYLASALRDSGDREGYHLMMTAGGDGTSLELATEIMALEPSERARFLVLRLPLGTGNDGSDGRELVTSLGRLLGDCRPVPRPAIRCSPAPGGGKQPLWSFNIASLGLDAFVAEMTNRLKVTFPGDSYKFWVDLSTVMYDFFYPVSPMRIRTWDGAGHQLRDFERKCLLVAVGASGNRQYGSDKRILPDANNVCAVSQTGLFSRLAFKGRIERGLHSGLPIVDLFSAARITIDSPAPLLFQADGEVLRLEPGDFPFTFDVEPDSYQVLEGSSAWR
ncbi:MAG TPA: diacylglycerol kinase family protein [Rectinemataceae bacterium]|nr:diacylglycerol kinase family protein [Rectinemataceae bacterium]